MDNINLSEFINLTVNDIDSPINNKLLKEIPNMTNLINLNLGFNNIKNLPNKISELTKLTRLHVINNKIKDLPKKITQLTNLTSLDLSKNQIKFKQLKKIKYFTNLQELYLSYNQLKKIPNEIYNLTNLKMLNLSNNQINKIDDNYTFPTGLLFLSISNNNIINIPNNIKYLTNLHCLDLSFNQITSIPNFIINLINLSFIKYNNNNIENITPIINRFLYRIEYPNRLHIYNDNQNIHDSKIQKCISISISNIINKYTIYSDDYYNIINNIIIDPILSENCKRLLLEYCDIKDIHLSTQITFEELLYYVWTHINSLDTRDEIKKILNNEINNSDCMCFIGKISRLINCLNGFTDLVTINISDTQQIGNIISMVKEELLYQNNYTIEKHKELVLKELIEREYNSSMIEEWISFIE